MDQSTRQKLAEAIKRRGGGVPVVECPVFFEILDELFVDEEAEMALALPDFPATADILSPKWGGNVEVAGRILEAMARKGILFSIERLGQRYYVLLPLVPGMMENQLITGSSDARTRKIAMLFDQYMKTLNTLSAGGRSPYPAVPFARVITIERNIPGGTQVQPYDRLLPYIEKAKHLAVVSCHCRHMGELLDNPCTKPKDVCMAVGPGARYMIEYGLGRSITNQEARDILTRAEEEGLVHCVNNTGKHIDFICNCCTCHCETLKSLKRSVGYGLAALSGFISSVSSDECIGCGDCVARCPMEALTLTDDTAVLSESRCIGCGLCVSSCPSGAIAMLSRPGAVAPYEDVRQLNQAIASSTLARKAEGP